MIAETQENRMAAESVAAVGIRVERASLVPPEVPPIPVFHFSLTRVGNQILLEPGFVDLVELRVALEQLRATSSAEPPGIHLYIKEKYIMDRETLVRLRDAIGEILQSMEESGEGETR